MTRATIRSVFDTLVLSAAILNFGFHAVLYGGAALGLWSNADPRFAMAALGCLWAAWRSGVLLCETIKPLDTPETKPL